MNASLVLKLELERRKAVNPRYSLRAFAQHLGIQPGRLSEYLNHQRVMSQTTQMKVFQKLGFHFKDSKIDFIEDKITLDEKTFSLIANPVYFYILALFDLNQFSGTAKEISKRLGLPANKTQEHIDKLLQMGFLKKENSKLTRIPSSLKTTTDRASEAIRYSHKITLKEIIDQIDEVPMEARDVTSITMAIDIKKIPLAKKLIQNFRKDLSELLESGDKTEVYNLNVQLFPVTGRK